VNQRVAAVADEAVLVVAGRVLRLDDAGSLEGLR
jgi:adenosyl cobinamide kinase/adenosyl cobinamide phosphate guanylyltransferase